MKIETTTKEAYPAVILRGDFETDSVGAFLTAIDQLRTDGEPRIMVSFRYLKYINSTALGAVVRARSACKADGGDLVILQPSRLSGEILTKMGLAGVLRMFDSEAAAADYLSGGDAGAEAAPGGTPAASEAVTVMFSFDDERSKMIPGKHKHGVGVLDSVDPTTLTFRWDPKKHDADPATAAALFTVGSDMRNKLQLKMIRKEFFEANSTIEQVTLDESGAAVIKARWSRMSEADRTALERGQEDLLFLREQAGD